ncbi:MAG: M20/M25/M40 family metallo-hydrolase, partial [Acidobacteria bacterium]|nr:M20/M25/M40 family metallo-hydrolase [Acidobacteriota bacterium]
MNPSVEPCVDFLCRLIQTESLPGSEEAIGRLVLGEMVRLGYDAAYVDDYGNVIGVIEGGGGPSLNFNTHLDHVDVGDVERWPHPPYGGEIHDGRVWGRGAVDIKGPLAAQVYGVGGLVGGERPAGDVYVSCVVQEEIGGVGARHLAETLVTPTVVVGEPSANTVRRGHRGRTELILHLVGRSVHASVPAKGVNPLKSLGRFLAALDDAERAQHPDLGRSSVAPTLLRTDQTSANVIPGEVWLTCDWRNVPSEDGDDALRSLRVILDASLGEGTLGEFEIPVFDRRTSTGRTMSIPASNPAYVLPPEHPAVITTARVVAEVTGETGPVGTWDFATDGGHYAAAGMAPVGFGPGDPYLAHTVDEHIEISALETALEVNRELAL